MFADGIITSSRGFLDVRLDRFTTTACRARCEIRSSTRKNVIIDPDGEEYDPDKWGEVFTTKWVTADDIAVLYNEEDAELLRARDNQRSSPTATTAISVEHRDRFGDPHVPLCTEGDQDNTNVMRNVRVIERQYRMLDKQKHFVSPEDWRHAPGAQGLRPPTRSHFRQTKFGFQVVPQARSPHPWTVICRQRRAARRLEPVQALHGGAVLPALPPRQHPRSGREPAGPVRSCSTRSRQPGAARHQHHGEQRLQGQGRLP
jgi:hypothetical protein